MGNLSNAKSASLNDGAKVIYLSPAYFNSGAQPVVETPAIPARMLEELNRIRHGSRPRRDSQGQQGTSIERSIEIVHRASELIKSKTDLAIAAERQVQVLTEENAKLVSMCTQAQTAMQELKRQLDSQVARAEVAETNVRRLQEQVAGMIAADEVARLSTAIESAFGPSLEDYTSEYASPMPRGTAEAARA